jgi:hypothetical protein
MLRGAGLPDDRPALQATRPGEAKPSIDWSGQNRKVMTADEKRAHKMGFRLSNFRFCGLVSARISDLVRPIEAFYSMVRHAR